MSRDPAGSVSSDHRQSQSRSSSHHHLISSPREKSTTVVPSTCSKELTRAEPESTRENLESDTGLFDNVPDLESLFSPNPKPENQRLDPRPDSSVNHRLARFSSVPTSHRSFARVEASQPASQSQLQSIPETAASGSARPRKRSRPSIDSESSPALFSSPVERLAPSAERLPPSAPTRRGRKPSKLDMKSKLEKSRQSARECRARKKLRYQYLEELVNAREKAILSLREELEVYKNWCRDMDEGRVPPDMKAKMEKLEKKLEMPGERSGDAESADPADEEDDDEEDEVDSDDDDVSDEEEEEDEEEERERAGGGSNR